MIYTLSWLPSITFLGVLMLLLIVTVFAVAAVMAAVLIALAILVAFAIAMIRSSLALARAARRRWPSLGRAGERAVEAAPRPVAVGNPQPHRVP